MYKYIGLLILLFACRETGQKFEKRKVGDKFVETTFKDTLYNGITKFYSLKGTLESKIYYNAGIKNGPAINYYSNGGINDSVNFRNGLEVGKHYLFDESGYLKYTDYFFFGKRVGGREFYENGKIYEYDFTDFDGRPIFSVKYDTNEDTQRYRGEVINLNVSGILGGNQTE